MGLPGDRWDHREGTGGITGTQCWSASARTGAASPPPPIGARMRDASVCVPAPPKFRSVFSRR